MLFTREFIDVENNAAGRVVGKAPREDGWDRTRELNTGRANTTALRTIFDRADANNRLIVYFPQGRYYLGLPQTALGPTESEQLADLVIPQHVTLRLGPGATLVPLAYSRAEALAARNMAWVGERERLLPEGERFRVRVEVQGAIDAPIAKIFDPFTDEDFDPTVMPTRPAGLVSFQRETVREVYPEWWGAIPMRGEDVELTPAEVRRTTAALQASIDAAFHHRVRMPNAAFEPTPPSRPSLPVVLTNNYLIDRPLRVGMTLAQAREQGTHTESYPPNQAGFVMRGECGPASSRGAAMIKASRMFQPEEAPERLPLFGDSSSLITLRLTTGLSIEDVVFDAAGVAMRCATVMTFSSAHHHSFEGCEFRDAEHTLLHLGGEFPATLLSVEDRVRLMAPSDTIDASLRYFSGGQDLGDLRVSRCHFKTGPGAGIRLLRAPFRKGDTLPGRWKHAVVYRTEPGLGTEFHGCAFEGTASPMILGLGGRISFQSCSFRTDNLAEAAEVSRDIVGDQALLRSWNGTDIHLGAPFVEMLPPPQPVVATSQPTLQPVVATMLTARNVESRSRQFLTTYPSEAASEPYNAFAFASVTLIQVRHQSDFDDERPAIYWAGPRNYGCPLVLQSCLFGPRPRGTTAEHRFKGGVFVAPSRDAAPSFALRPVLLIGTRRVGGGALLGSTLPTVPAVMLISAG